MKGPSSGFLHFCAIIAIIALFSATAFALERSPGINSGSTKSSHSSGGHSSVHSGGYSSARTTGSHVYHGSSYSGYYGRRYYGGSRSNITVIAGPDYYPYYYYWDTYPSVDVDETPAVADVLQPPAPVALVPNEVNPPQAASDTLTIGIPNSKGGFTSVKLVKRKAGYTGPQGEFYSGHPTVEQLKVLYGGS
ncbi:MAG TPA: hypothetical protein VLX68_02350 [Chitinivibrionales bacterium]|nr:hypothetical protein [Chitinivibrionales bacterium]